VTAAPLRVLLERVVHWKTTRAWRGVALACSVLVIVPDGTLHDGAGGRGGPPRPAEAPP
jgi:hypothetical protein